MLKYKNYYFIGIGGIGMSALARLLKSDGVNVYGSDINSSEVIEALQKEGININIGQISENISDEIDCVVYTLAIPEDNPEFMESKKRDLPMFTYAEMLGKISLGMKTIAVSGTHGKTTTTAMLNFALNGSGIKPHTIVGSILSETGSNYVKGEGDYFLVEACEYKKSFLNLNPEILIITNIEEDHLDFYNDLSDIQNAFLELAGKTKGNIVCNPNDKNLKPIIDAYSDKIIDYTKFLSKVPEMKVIGQHNILNGAAVLAVVNVLDGDLEGAQKSLSEFKGTWRRLEYKGKNEEGVILYDDYAHHPSEIIAGLKSLKNKYSDKKINVIFQPHLYSRTKIFLNEIVEALCIADEIYLLPIYAAREKFDPEISSEMLAEKINGAKFLTDFDSARKLIHQKKSNDLVVTMGAGDVYQILNL